MKIEATSLPEVKLLTLDTHRDDRGFFVERYHAEHFAAHGLPVHWAQENHSRSRRSVLRGLHYQLRRPQGKLVGCVRGTVFDVAVDVRAGSPTFGRWTATTLTDDVPQLLWIPPGFAHGFCVLSDTADVAYRCTTAYDALDERGVIWNDRTLAIQWPIPDPLLSAKDAALPSLADADLPRFVAVASHGG